MLRTGDHDESDDEDDLDANDDDDDDKATTSTCMLHPMKDDGERQSNYLLEQGWSKTIMFTRNRYYNKHI